MEVFFVLLVIICLAGFYIISNKDKLDKNQDGKLDVEEVKAAAEPIVAKVEEAVKPLDLNNDGKVNLADAEEAVKLGKSKAKEKVAEVTTEVKKRVGRKPKSQA